MFLGFLSSRAAAMARPRGSCLGRSFMFVALEVRAAVSKRSKSSILLWMCFVDVFRSSISINYNYQNHLVNSLANQEISAVGEETCTFRRQGLDAAPANAEQERDARESVSCVICVFFCSWRCLFFCFTPAILTLGNIYMSYYELISWPQGINFRYLKNFMTAIMTALNQPVLVLDAEV